MNENIISVADIDYSILTKQAEALSRHIANLNGNTKQNIRSIQSFTWTMRECYDKTFLYMYNGGPVDQTGETTKAGTIYLYGSATKQQKEIIALLDLVKQVGKSMVGLTYEITVNGNRIVFDIIARSKGEDKKITKHQIYHYERS